MQQVRAKKSLGQHFLIDLDVAGRIAVTIDDYKHLPVLEVGPGMGVLTQFLLQNGHDLKVVELDGESVEYLNANFPALAGRIIEQDFLKLDLTCDCDTVLCDHRCTILLVEYYVSSLRSQSNLNCVGYLIYACF